MSTTSSPLSHEILSYVASHGGGVGFHQLTRKFGLPDVDLPGSVEDLVDAGLLALQLGGDGQARKLYVITEQGRKALIS